eukprot:3845425-Prymnesium_polylepis.1
MPSKHQGVLGGVDHRGQGRTEPLLAPDAIQDMNQRIQQRVRAMIRLPQSNAIRKLKPLEALLGTGVHDRHTAQQHHESECTRYTRDESPPHFDLHRMAS